MVRVADSLSESFNFRTGITGTSRTQGDSANQLPAQTDLLPAEAGIASHLEALFGQRSLDDHLLDTIKPQLRQPGLLVPTHFSKVLGETEAALATRAQDRRQAPADARTLRNALRVLVETRRHGEDLQGRRHELILVT